MAKQWSTGNASDPIEVVKEGPNTRALRKSLRALTGLDDRHAAQIQHAKTLARLVDTFPFEVKLHSEYREAMKRLTDAGQPETADAFDVLLEQIREEV